MFKERAPIPLIKPPPLDELDPHLSTPPPSPFNPLLPTVCCLGSLDLYNQT